MLSLWHGVSCVGLGSSAWGHSLLRADRSPQRYPGAELPYAPAAATPSCSIWAEQCLLCCTKGAFIHVSKLSSLAVSHPVSPFMAIHALPVATTRVNTSLVTDRANEARSQAAFPAQHSSAGIAESPTDKRNTPKTGEGLLGCC